MHEERPSGARAIGDRRVARLCFDPVSLHRSTLVVFRLLWHRVAADAAAARVCQSSARSRDRLQRLLVRRRGRSTGGCRELCASQPAGHCHCANFHAVTNALSVQRSVLVKKQNKPQKKQKKTTKKNPLHFSRFPPHLSTKRKLHRSLLFACCKRRPNLRRRLCTDTGVCVGEVSETKARGGERVCKRASKRAGNGPTNRKKSWCRSANKHHYLA